MDEKLTEREIFNTTYMIKRRAGRSDDELDSMVCDLLDHQAARIVELEAQVAALTNAARTAAYSMGVSYEKWATASGRGEYSWAWQLFKHREVQDGDTGFATEDEARAAGEAYMVKLAAGEVKP